MRNGTLNAKIVKLNGRASGRKMADKWEDRARSSALDRQMTGDQASGSSRIRGVRISFWEKRRLEGCKPKPPENGEGRGILPAATGRFRYPSARPLGSRG